MSLGSSEMVSDARIPSALIPLRHEPTTGHTQASIEPCANCDALPFVFVILWE